MLQLRVQNRWAPIKMKKEIFIGTIPAHEESQTSDKTVSPNEVDISLPAEKECKYMITGNCSL